MTGGRGKKSLDVEQDDAQGLPGPTGTQLRRRSKRANAGQNGYAVQQHQVVIAMKTPARRPATKQQGSLLDEEPVNPMAPTPHPPGRSRKKPQSNKGSGKKKASLASQPGTVQMVMPVSQPAPPDGRFGYQVPEPVPTFVGSQSVEDFEQDRVKRNASRLGAKGKSLGSSTHTVPPPRSSALRTESHPAPRSDTYNRTQSSLPPSSDKADEDGYPDVVQKGPGLPAIEEEQRMVEEQEDEELDEEQDEEMDEEMNKELDEEMDEEVDEEMIVNRQATDMDIDGLYDSTPEHDFRDEIMHLDANDDNDNNDNDNEPTQRQQSWSSLPRSSPVQHRPAGGHRPLTGQSEQRLSRQPQPRSNAGNNLNNQVSVFGDTNNLNRSRVPSQSRVQPLQSRVPAQSRRPQAAQPSQPQTRVVSQARTQAQGQQGELLSPPPSRSHSISRDQLQVDNPGKSHRLGDESVGVDYDVLKRHQTTNGRRRPPSPTLLDSVRENGTGKHKKVKKNPTGPAAAGGGFGLPNDSHSSAEELEADEATASGQVQSHIKRNGRWSVNSKETVPIKPTTLRAYPTLWVKCLDSAKARMRRHIAVFDAFPPITSAVNGPCNEALLETLADYQADGRELEKEVTYEERGSDMCRLIYNDVSTFRSEIKKTIASVVPIHYQLYPPSSAKTEAERIKFIRDKAQALLQDGRFLRGEPDENGKTSNFGHEGLKQACFAVFYSNKPKALRQFPEMQTYIPYNALTLIATFVHAVLGIFMQHGHVPLHLKLDVRQLKETYDKLDRNLERVKSDNYHGNKLDNMLEEWATLGMTGYAQVATNPAGNDESLVVLD